MLAALLLTAGLSTAVLIGPPALMPSTALHLPARLFLLVCSLATLLAGLLATLLSTLLSALLHSSLLGLAASPVRLSAPLLGLLAATLVCRVTFPVGPLLGFVLPVLLRMLMWLLGRALLAALLTLLLTAFLALGLPRVLATSFAMCLSFAALSTASLAAPVSFTHNLVVSGSRCRSWSGRASVESDECWPDADGDV